MKKSTILGIVILLTIIILSAIIYIVATKNCDVKLDVNDEISDIYDKYPNDVDSAIQEFMANDEYVGMSVKQRVNKAGKILELYEKHNIIVNLYLDEQESTYTFQYNTGDIKGALGAVMLKTWDPMMN